MKTGTWVVLIAALLALSLGAAALLYFGEKPADLAEIYSGGVFVRAVRLNEDQEFTVAAPDGGSNTVTIRQGKIAVTHADCPDQWCVRQGFRAGGGDIVCLPHRLVITFRSGEDSLDGMVG